MRSMPIPQPDRPKDNRSSCRRGRVLFRPRHRGDQPHRARRGQGGRRSRDHRHPADQDRGDRRRDVPQAARSGTRLATMSAACCAASIARVSSAEVLAKRAQSSRTQVQGRPISSPRRARPRRSSAMRPQFYFRTTDVTGVVQLPGHRDGDGDNIAMTVD